MRKRNTNHLCFTIVDFLFDVVVIAILAAISIIAYTGIQNRAYDSAVKNDLANFVKKVLLIAAESGDIPTGAHVVASDGSGSGSGSRTGSPTSAPKLTLSKNAYPHAIGGGMANFIYCEGTGTHTGDSVWAIVARGKSGRFSI